jgi:hypothetical protein
MARLKEVSQLSDKLCTVILLQELEEPAIKSVKFFLIPET